MYLRLWLRLRRWLLSLGRLLLRCNDWCSLPNRYRRLLHRRLWLLRLLELLGWQ